MTLRKRGGRASWRRGRPCQGNAVARSCRSLEQVHLLQWRPMPRNTLLASRCPVLLRFRRFSYGERDIPTPNTNRRPGVSGLGFLWKVSCGVASPVSGFLSIG
eukprot:8351714-Pyramimonas_sp.AAC.1